MTNDAALELHRLMRAMGEDLCARMGGRSAMHQRIQSLERALAPSGKILAERSPRANREPLRLR